jgi:hypothetical protein
MRAAPLQTRDERVEATAVETQAVDERPVFLEPEHARPRVAELRPRRHRANLDKTEAEAQQRVGGAGILVEAGGDADRVREVAAPDPRP